MDCQLSTFCAGLIFTVVPSSDQTLKSFIDLDSTTSLMDLICSYTGISANATIEDAVELDQDANDNANRTKRAIKEEEEVREDDSEEKCRTEMWRCLSKVIEGGLHYMDQPQGILG